MANDGLGSDIGQIPELVERYTAAAKRGCGIPVLAKLTPNVQSLVPAALAARRGGADGLAAINTIKSIMGENLHTYVSSPAVHGMSADGGHQAISIGRDRKPVLDLRRCVGCHLCVLVCPTDSILPYNKRREPLA